MVFLTLPLFKRILPPDKFWRAQQYMRFAQNFRGRKRNCYQLSIRFVHKALSYATVHRKVKKQNMVELWNMRIQAASQEHGLEGKDFMEGLARCHIQLDRKVLTDLAIYEPRTFLSLTEISKKKLEDEGIAPVDMPKAEGVITRGML